MQVTSEQYAEIERKAAQIARRITEDYDTSNPLGMLVYMVMHYEIVRDNAQPSAETLALRAEVASLRQQLARLADPRPHRRGWYNHTPAESAAYQRGYSTGYQAGRRRIKGHDE